MAVASLGLAAVFGVVAVGLRSWLHTRRTGKNPFRGGAGVGGVAAVCGNAVAFTIGPVLDLTGVAGRLAHGALYAVLGIALASASLVITVWSQLAMGDAWRIGVDPSERTTLVMSGPFRWIRNPIYTAMIVFAAGLALIVPNVGSLLGFLFVATALEVHVRHVEEPYLATAFDSAYRSYASAVGRFVPGIGKLAG